MKHPFQNSSVSSAFDTLAEAERRGLLALRDLIFETAEETSGVGRLEETLKWGQPSYLTPDTKSGSTLRLGLAKNGDIALFTHCQTSLISDFRDLFPHDFRFEGNRAVHFQPDEDLPLDKIRLLIRAALTYHSKRQT